MGLPVAVRTDFTLQALRMLRNPHLFKWYAVTLLVIVIYVYANEVERGRCMFMFALAGVVYAKLLPAGRATRVLGIPKRLAVGLGLSIISVAVELFLHATGTFPWEYWWWNTPFVLLIIVFGYLWFFLYAAWVYDAPDARTRWTRLGGLAAIDLAMGLVFGVGFGWL